MAVGDHLTLREQFMRDGHVEIRVSAAKVIGHVLVITAIVAAVIATAWSYSFIAGILGTLLAVWAVGGFGLLWLDQVLGAGPALRVDHDGVTIRRWGEPLVLRWSDVYLFFERLPQNRFGRQLALQMSEWVWHDYRTGRPKILSWGDRVSHYRGSYLVFLKVLDSSAREVLEFLDDETVDTLTRLERPYRLVLDFNEDSDSPLWMRGGREAPLAKLPLSPELRVAAVNWNRNLTNIAQDAVPIPSPHAPLVSDGRALAVQLEQGLGQGSQVLASPDVPRFGHSS